MARCIYFDVRNYTSIRCWLLALLLFVAGVAPAQQKVDLEKVFNNPPASARPWAIWYWMHAAVSREGIKADLEAMKEVGIGGAYLMSIKDTSSKIPFQSTARQLTPEWWALVKYAMEEAKRLDITLAMHVSDGFALAGGPWITPELSMQKLVWTKTFIKSGNQSAIQLPQPKTNEGYYKDVAVFAYPANYVPDSTLPTVTTSTGVNADFLADPKGKGSFRSDTNCWIQYNYPKAFTCRSIRVHVGGNNFQAQRLIVQASNDGVQFRTITRLVPPRHGWQDTDEDYTYSLPATTARYFRLLYQKEGTEPGAEDIDAAKWKPSLKVNGIYLSGEPVINNYEAKNGSVWRVAEPTNSLQVTNRDAVPLRNILNLSSKLDKSGRLNWKAPAGDWIIVRIGHTSTGHTNYTGGAGLGLECDKFNPVAIQKQFDNWFAKAFEKTDPVLAKQVLKIFHMDSWECGSQNWSPVFAAEFKKRRGYDLTPYLLAMTGVPVGSAVVSEKFLHDVRQTIAELVVDVFYKKLNTLAHGKGTRFSGEAIAPTMVSDGLWHYKYVDIPMGEFWINSPTHDKPNDMLDAISAGHIYGKKVINAESFTSVRMNWAEHPGNLKIVGDRNFALGINKISLHVFTQNPWLDKKPGMTLDGVGLYYQRDQTWFKQSKAWIDYLARCSGILQMGTPVTDVAVFTGEEVPRRAILPDRLVSTLPGIFGSERVAAEQKRLANAGEPLRQIPDGVTHSANMADPEDWVDPLRGYAYDSFNPDALMMMTVKNGKVVLPGGASYSVLVFPGKHPMQPNNRMMSLPVAKKIVQLVKEGATIIIDRSQSGYAGIGRGDQDAAVNAVLKELFDNTSKKGRVILAPYFGSSFANLGVPKDLVVSRNTHPVAWTHRRADIGEIYFIANQAEVAQVVKLSFPQNTRPPVVYDPQYGKLLPATARQENGRTIIEWTLEAAQSIFVVFPVNSVPPVTVPSKSANAISLSFLNKWQLRFEPGYGGPAEALTLDTLRSWTSSEDPAVKYYSGRAVYSNSFHIDSSMAGRSLYIAFDSICNIATVRVNGVACGTLWTKPYRLELGSAVKVGENKIEIEVANTWHNRLIGDNLLPEEKRVTWTTAPFRLRNKPLLPAGIIGDIKLYVE